MGYFPNTPWFLLKNVIFISCYGRLWKLSGSVFKGGWKWLKMHLCSYSYEDNTLFTHILRCPLEHTVAFFDQSKKKKAIVRPIKCMN